MISFWYEFSDLFNNKISIDSIDKFSDDFFESNKIYIFNGFYYDNKTLYATNFASIEMVEENSVNENNYFLKDLDKIKIGQIEFSVFIEEFNSHEKVKIKLWFNQNNKS